MNTIQLAWLPNPVILYKNNWKIAWMNEEAKKVLGYKDSSQWKSDHIFQTIPRENHSKILQVEAQLKNDPQATVAQDLYHISTAQQFIPLRSTFGTVNSDKGEESFHYIQSAFICDFSHQKENGKERMESNFSVLAENLPGLEMFLVDKNLQVQCRLGKESHTQGWRRDAAEKPDFLEFFPEELKETLLSLLKIVFEKTPVSSEFSSGKSHFSIRMVPLAENGQKDQCLAILQNITDVKRVQEKLRESKEKAIDASEAKDRFVAKMSHEIRTPLNAVIGFSDQLYQTRLTRKQSDYLNIIDNASQHLLSIIDDILVLSKIESEEIEIEKSPFDLGEMLNAAGQVLKHKYEEKGLDFRINTDETISTKILSGDAAKLRQVLINLGNNAIKFTHKGNVTISCKPLNQTSKDVTLHFEVSDTGIGIAEEQKEKIFEPFNQVDNQIDRNFTGCGLGLAICKELLEAMGSRLELESTPGKGSKFFFAITLDKGVKQQPISPKHPPGRKPTKNIKVLFVDDDPVNRLLGSVILKKCRIKADFAASGSDALKMFRPGRYQLIFLDINMPEINGVEVIRSIREEEKNTPRTRACRVIAMTANTVRKQVREYLKAGMDTVMLKPYKEETFVRHIYSAPSPAPNEGKSKTKKAKQPKEPKNKQIFDLQQLREITRGDKDFMQIMLNSFIENGNLMKQKMMDDLEKADFKGIAEAAHRLHPSMEQLGLRNSSQMLKEIEKKYLRKETVNPNPELVKSTIKEVTIAINAISKALKEL